MLDSGNFVLYDYNNISRIIWQSFDHPTDTLLEGQSLPPGSHLTSSLSETNSSTGRFHLYMQGDGNLVMYPAYTAGTAWDAYWSSDTAAGYKVQYHLYLNKTGLLQIWNRSNDYSLITTLNDDEEGQQNTGNQAIAFPIKTTSNRAVVHIIVSSVIFCSAIFISIHYMYKIRVLKYKRLIETGNIGGLSEDLALRRFTYNELEKLVEEGEREFHAEVRAIGKTHHRC